MIGLLLIVVEYADTVSAHKRNEKEPEADEKPDGVINVIRTVVPWKDNVCFVADSSDHGRHVVSPTVDDHTDQKKDQWD